jgi:phospholipid transport system substrate-binding protein
MTNRRTLLGLTATVFVGYVMASRSLALASVDAGGATAFVKSTGEQIVAIVNGASGERQKRVELARIVDAAVDVEGVARFCLGRYWQRASAEQQREFVQAFRSMLVTNIAGKLGEYEGVRFSVGQALQRDGGLIVLTTIERRGSAPERVQWLIADVGGAPKIEDMITEGISMRLTQRNDYEAFLNNNGNNIDILIRGLKQKAAQLAVNQSG